MFIIPKDGLAVVDPALKDRLPPEGREVGNDNPLYWHRHLADGSVTVGAPPAKPQGKTKPAPEPKE